MKPFSRKVLGFVFAAMIAVNAAILLKVFLPVLVNPKAPPRSAVADAALASGRKVFDSMGSDASRAAAMRPAGFRSLDRRDRFDVVLLRGPSAVCVPMVRHFAQTRDWTLVALDHAAMQYERGAGEAWTPDRLAPAAEVARGKSHNERVAVLGGFAERLVWLEHWEPARQYLDEAERLDGDSPAILTLRALWKQGRGEPGEAVEFADRALAADARYAAALYVKVAALTQGGKTQEAYGAAGELVKLQPEQPAALFLLAQCAHTVGAYGREIETLQKLIDLARAAKTPAAGYQLYLAQAYAKRGGEGDGEKAVKEYDAAALSGELDSDAARQARETAEQIRSRLALPAPAP